MLYNTFICLISGFTGIIVFILLQRLRKKEKREYSEMLDYAILVFGLLWLSSALRTFFLWLGRPDLDLLVWIWFVNPLFYIHIAFFFFYASWALFRNKKIRFILNGVFALLTLLILSISFKYKPMAGEITYWGTEPIINPLISTLLAFLIFIPILALVVIEFFRRLKIWIRTKNLIDRQLLGIHASILAYGSAGIFETFSFLQNWTLLLVRIGIMICIFSIYLFATSDTRE